MPIVIDGTTGITSPNGSATSPSLVGSDNNTGIFFPADNTLGLSTAGVSRMQIASDGQQSSVIPGGTTLYNEYKCRAWVNFSGLTSPGTIRSSGNMSSVTRNATADYTLNFITAMPDADYAAIGVAYNPPNAAAMMAPCTNVAGVEQAPTTTTFRFSIIGRDGSANNTKYTFVAVFR